MKINPKSYVLFSHWGYYSIVPKNRRYNDADSFIKLSHHFEDFTSICEADLIVDIENGECLDLGE